MVMIFISTHYSDDGCLKIPCIFPSESKLVVAGGNLTPNIKAGGGTKAKCDICNIHLSCTTVNFT